MNFESPALAGPSPQSSIAIRIAGESVEAVRNPVVVAVTVRCVDAHVAALIPVPPALPAAPLSGVLPTASPSRAMM